MSWKTLAATSAAVAAAATVGAIATDPGTGWYRRLDKPSWQPPPPAYGIAWTPIYALLACAGARALERAGRRGWRRFAAAYGMNLALNAGWNWVFFRGRRLDAALVEILALEVSNVDLLRRAWAVDRLAGAALVPYVAWTAFATALTAELTRRNQMSTRGAPDSSG